MSFLKKFGIAVLKVTQLVTGLGPIIGLLIPGSGPVTQLVNSELIQLADIITKVEAIGQVWGQPGAEKLRVAGPLVAQIILSSSLMANKKIANTALFNQAATEIAGGMADLLNSLHDDGVKEENKA